MTDQRFSPRSLLPSSNNAETLATVDGVVVYVTDSVPVILLPAGSTAADVPAGTPVGTIIVMKG